MAATDNVPVKLLLTGIIVVLAVPGLVIEPGPLTEIVALTFLVSIWFSEEPPDSA